MNFKKAIKEYFLEIFSGFFLSITVLVVIVNVILRYFFNTSLSWAEEVSTSSFIWAIFIGSAAAYKHKKHIGIDLLKKILPHSAAIIVDLLVNLFMMIISGFITYLSIVFILNTKGKTTAVLEISANYINAALVVAFAFITYYSLIFAISDFKLIRKKEVLS